MSGAPSQSGKWGPRVALAAVIVLGGYFGVSYLTRSVAQVVSATRSKAVRTVPGTVEVEAEYNVPLKSEVGGRVKTSELDVGRKVRMGDVLVVLDSGDVDLEIERIGNELVAARKRRDLGSTLRADVLNSQDTLAELERRMKQGGYPAAEYEKENRKHQQLKQRMELDEVALRLAVEALENALKAREREKAKMTILAPSDGVVTEVYARVGHLIGANSPIADLISVGRTIKAKLSEENFAAVELGQRATVRFLTFGDEQYPATVSKLSPAADAATQRYAVHLDVTLPAGREVMPGLTGEVQIIIAERPNAITVPRRALVGDYLYVVEDGKVQLTKVEKGYESLNYVEILKGIEADAQVIVEQQDRFRSGERVRTEVLEN